MGFNSPKEEAMWQAIQEEAEVVGIAAFNSDVWALLSLILAYYEERGNDVVELVTSDIMKRTIKHRREFYVTRVPQPAPEQDKP